MKYRILIVDDHLVVRTGVTIILQNEIDNLNISYASNFLETINLLNHAVFDLIILDINIPGGKNTEMIVDIRSIQSNVKILMFSAHEEEFYALRYIHAGADGYLNKLSGEDKIVEAVKSIMNFGKYLTYEIIEKLNNFSLQKEPFNPFDKLSKREIEIVKLLIKGEGNLEISNNLGIQMSTVSTYKNRVFEKLKINNLVELIEKYNLYYF
jgi:DNA-binding NarL/FixJ family response regulator